MGTGLIALLVLLSVGFSQESLDFSPAEVCTAWVDSVWFSEETLPNDSNIVEICYSLESNCPDSAFEISVSISADSGTTWVSAGEGWFSTLMDTAGALGTVSPGTHCFKWLMGEDITSEQSNWLIRATVYFHRELTMFWPMFHYDAQNTGRSPYVLCSDESLSILWSIDAGAPINYSAVSCGPTIYFATSDGVLHAVKYDGTVLWTASTGASTRAGPAVLDDGSIILGNSNGTMTCFNTDGTVRWTWTSSLSVSPCGLWHCPSIGPDGRIRTAGDHGGFCWEGSLICLGQDGTFYWERDIPAGGDGCYCSPAVDLGNLSFTTDIGNDPCGALTCYNTDGTIRWRWNGYPHSGEVDIGSSPTIDVTRNRIYFGTNRSSKGLVAVDYDPSGTSHSMAWFYGTNPRDINWCPAIDWDGNIYIGTNDGGTGTSILFSFAPDGSVRWADSINCGSISDPVVDSAGHIIVGASNGYLYVFNTDGDSLTSVYLGGRVNSPILGTGGNIYVGTNANRFYAVGCEIFEPRDSSTSAVSGPLDSSPPSIELVCPTGTYHPGDTVHIEWTIEDSFLLSSSCSLRIYLCERETTFAIPGTETDFAIPAESYGCDSIYFEIVAGDSFGNISSAQCGIAVACSVWIDSVWFSEETECNDSNIVEICYILDSDCPESTYNILISISIDSGASWVPAGSLWFSTVYDTGGDLGAVPPGTHCFYWVISSDTLNVETENAMIKVELHDILDTTVVATGPLDSRGPSTDLVCPDTFFLIGDTVNLSWSVSDLFWNHLPGSLFVNYCGPETVIAVEDSSISFVIPDYFAGCDSMLLTLAVRDSFCNWGYDTCTIPIITCVPATAWLVCPYSESLTITSCNDQNVTFAILDTSGFPIDTTRVFIHKEINGEYHPVPIDSLTFYYIEDTLFITIPGIYSDNDTISVVLDSVFNIAGCPTRF